MANIPDLAKDILEALLVAEEKARHSPEYVRECDEVKDEVNGWLRISAEYQKKIAKSFGFKDGIEVTYAVDQMRRATQIYPELREISVYRRENLANKGKFRSGDTVPNVIIHKRNLSEIRLYDTFSQEIPNVLILSSHT